jgi:dienelactone hydrolase
MKMQSTAILRDLIIAGILLAPNGCVGQAIEGRSVLSPAEPPAGTERLHVKWVTAANPGAQPILMAIARPDGAGPFSVIVLFHGTHGFAHEYVRLAEELAQGGFIAVAACWFSGQSGGGTRFVTPPIECPPLPLVTADSPQAVARVATIVRAVREIPGARPDRIALFGHSRGAGAATSYAMQASDLRALILDSGGYPPEYTARAAEIQAAVLMLHGAADSPADGGVAVTGVQMAHDFEAALRRAGKSVEAKYYETGGHNSLFSDPAQRRDEVRRILGFLREHNK